MGSESFVRDVLVLCPVFVCACVVVFFPRNWQQVVLCGLPGQPVESAAAWMLVRSKNRFVIVRLPGFN